MLGSSLEEQREMSFVFYPIDEASARAVMSWRYSEPYDIYNLASGEAEDDLQYLIDPQNAFYCVANRDGELVAYCSFSLDGQVPGGDYSAEALDIGMGIHPDLTGQGRGSLYVKAVLDFARRAFAPVAFRVTVAEFNRRAIRVWEKARFQPVERFRGGKNNRVYVILVREEGTAC